MFAASRPYSPGHVREAQRSGNPIPNSPTRFLALPTSRSFPAGTASRWRTVRSFPLAGPLPRTKFPHRGQGLVAIGGFHDRRRHSSSQRWQS